MNESIQFAASWLTGIWIVLLVNVDVSLWLYRLVFWYFLMFQTECLCEGYLLQVWVCRCSAQSTQQLRAEIFTSVYHFLLSLHAPLSCTCNCGNTADVCQVSDQISLSGIILCHGGPPDASTGPRAATTLHSWLDRSEVSRGGGSGGSDTWWRCSRSWGPRQTGLPAGVHDCVNDWGGNNTFSVWK